MDRNERYKETLATWNRIAMLYQDKFMDLDLYNDTYDAFCARISKKAPEVLEIGCGPGNITRYLLARRPDLRIEATDASPDMVALARQNNPSAQCRVLDARAIGALHKKYDAIVCGFCIPYLSPGDAAKMIRDGASLLAREGLFYLSFVEGDPGDSGYQAGSSGDRTYFYYHDPELIRGALAENHFTIAASFRKDYLKSDGTTEVHTIILAQKQERP